MSLLNMHILTDAQFNALKAAGHAVEPFIISEAGKVVAGLAKTEIGTAVAADIQAVASHDKTGAEKFETVVANTLPLVLKYAAGGGVAAVEADVISITRALVQEIYTDTASQPFAKIAGALLRLLGL